MLAICFTIKIIKEKECDYDTTTFLYHFIVNAIFDVIQAFSILVFQKFLHWDILISLYLTNKWITKLYAPILYMSILGSVLGCLITVINRYCALCHIVFFKQMWTKSLCFKLIFLQILLPILLFSFNLFYDVNVIYVSYFNFYTFTIMNNIASVMNNVILSTITFIATVITIVLNIIILRKYSEIMINTNAKERSKRFLMLIYMGVTTLCLLALSIEQFVRLYFGIVDDKIGIYYLTFVLYWIIPIFTIVQPVITLIMSKQLRKYFLCFYFNPFLPQKYKLKKSFTTKTTVSAIKKTTIHI